MVLNEYVVITVTLYEFISKLFGGVDQRQFVRGAGVVAAFLLIDYYCVAA